MKRIMIAASVCLLAACSDGPTAPPEAVEFAPTAAFALADLAASTDVTYGMLHGSARIWDAEITAVGAGTFAGNAALVEPGSSISMVGKFQRGPITDMSYCPGCIIQNYLAWVPDAAANGATPFNLGLQSGGNSPYSPKPVIAFSWTTNAPTVSGIYYIGHGGTLDYVFQPWAQGGMGVATADPSVVTASFVIQVRGNPATKDDCKKGGWEDFEFKNQGQCVRYVETGKDSR